MTDNFIIQSSIRSCKQKKILFSVISIRKILTIKTNNYSSLKNENNLNLMYGQFKSNFLTFENNKLYNYIIIN